MKRLTFVAVFLLLRLTSFFIVIINFFLFIHCFLLVSFYFHLLPRPSSPSPLFQFPPHLTLACSRSSYSFYFSSFFLTLTFLIFCFPSFLSFFLFFLFFFLFPPFLMFVLPLLFIHCREQYPEKYSVYSTVIFQRERCLFTDNALLHEVYLQFTLEDRIIDFESSTKTD